MGVGGLKKLIESRENIDACCPWQQIGGKLIVDGNDLLHELYRDRKLDWAHGGQYPQLRATVIEFFGALQRQGVQPIVLLDGGGDESFIEDLVHRRNLSIRELPEHRRQELANPHSNTRHYLPLLAGVVLANTLEELRVPIYFAYGKADPTIVRLANHYRCPVLGCDSNYCLYNLEAGYIHYQCLKWRERQITARVFNQDSFAQNFRLQEPMLCLLLPALLGDGSDKSIRYIYGALKPLLQQDVPKCLAVLQYARDFRSYQEFIDKIPFLQRDQRSKENVRANCDKAKRLYVVSTSISCEDLAQQMPFDRPGGRRLHLPDWAFQQYRKGHFHPFLVNAAVVGKCPLNYLIGDESQLAPPVLGRPIRQVTYGLMSGLIDRNVTKIVEYYRNSDPGAELQFAEHEVWISFDRFQELSVANLGQLVEEERKSLAKEMFSSFLNCPSVMDRFDNWEESSWILVVAATKFWASNRLVSKQVPNLAQVVRALIYSFVHCYASVQTQQDTSAAATPAADLDSWQHPNWLKAYHAFLQWQCVWCDITALNQLLKEPFEVLSPACLFDGRLALYYATCRDPRQVDVAARTELSAKNKELFDKLVAAVL